MVRDITERKQAEEAQKQSELLFRGLFELSPDSVVLIDPNDPDVSWPVIDCNAAACLMNGYSRDELIGHSIDILNANPGAPAERIAYMQQLRQAGNLKFESLHRHKNGTLFPIEVSTTLIKIGERELVIGIDRDITGRKQSEETLIRAEQKFRSIFENATEGIHQTTYAGKIISVNLAGARMLGFDSPEEFMADAGYLNSHFYVQPERRAEFLRLMETQGRLSNFESEVYRKDGSTAWISENVHSVRDELGNLLYFEGTSTEITQRKRAEAALIESEQRYRRAIAAAGLVPYGIDYAANCFTFIGEDILKLTGFTSQEFTPDILKECVLESQFWGLEHDGITPEEANRRFMAGEITKWGNDLHIRTRSGEQRWISDVSVPLLDEHGRVTSAIGIFQDLTERKQAEAELQASRVAERNFAERLTILSETTTELSLADNLDALCRRAVELGRERLDFDRLSIFFLLEDSATMAGTFGVDGEGRITDERGTSFPILSNSNIWSILRSETPLLRLTDEPLYLQGKVVGQGTHVYAGLWDGNTAIGFITVDNLLRLQPISDSDCEIIRLYASALGPSLLTSTRRVGTANQPGRRADFC